jgi:hypothetical protein
MEHDCQLWIHGSVESLESNGNWKQKSSCSILHNQSKPNSDALPRCDVSSFHPSGRNPQVPSKTKKKVVLRGTSIGNYPRIPERPDLTGTPETTTRPERPRPPRDQNDRDHHETRTTETTTKPERPRPPRPPISGLCPEAAVLIKCFPDSFCDVYAKLRCGRI